MKFKTVTLLSLGMILFLSACQKDKQPDTNASALKVKAYTEKVATSDGDTILATYNLSYDANNRITSINQVEVPGNKFLFTYTSDAKYSMDIYVMGTLSIHEDFFLNSIHLVDSTLQYNDTEDTTTEKYFYNANNQLTTLKEYATSVLDNVTSFTYDSDGNVVKTTDTNKQTETFEYYPDLVYAMPVLNPSLQSAKPMQLLKTHKVTSNGYLVGSTINTYTFDTANRINTITQTLDDGSFYTQTFTYF